MSFDIIPAIDLRAGQVVRLAQGDYARQTRYADAPLVVATRYAEAGARWLHLVDLDGARDGAFANTALLREVAALGLRVQAGGGVRDESDVERLLAAGATRVVVGSVAIREPQRVADWIAHFGAEQLVIALDARWRDGAWRLPSAGWTQEENADLSALADHY
ncbi:MAG TPA: HisA/HisF-related TIM barrel protein, partial [Rhodanobacteraceae bacterium]|nr:HisA/HisF-related TIM barrel protein [Rhodanobacteraceae bacterium]